MRMVNKILLAIMEHSKARLLIEIFVILYKEALDSAELRSEDKLINLLIKCIWKSTGNPSFKLNAKDNITFLFRKFSEIITQHHFTSESPQINTYSTMFV